MIHLQQSFAISGCHRLLLVVALLVMTASPRTGACGDQPPALALQGFSGILNIPTAHVQEQGSLNALYSNQRDRFHDRGVPVRQDNYLFSVGLFSAAEIGGRLTATSRDVNSSSPWALGIRDLSANAKLTSAPFTAGLPLAPAVALGIQDIGGGFALLRTTYLVGSVDPFAWMRLSAGYGLGPDRMKGGFGGVELKAHEWLTLLGEYDARTVNAGLRFTSPPLPYIPARFTFSAAAPLSRSGNLVVAAGFTLPLDFKQQAASEKGTVAATKSPVSGQHSPEPRTPKPETRTSNLEPQTPNHEPATSLSSLLTRLKAAGFVNVRVGVLGGTVLVVEYENIRFNHNELDALGVVAGLVSEAEPTGIENVWLVIKRRGIRLLRVSAPLKELHDWMTAGTGTPPVIQVDQDPGSRDGIHFVAGDDHPGWLRPSLMLSPGLTTYVGTEVGVLDYLLSIKPDLGVPLWRGGLLSARFDVPVSWSENFRNGRVYASSRHDARMDRLMLFQGISLLPGVMANLGGGMIQYDTYGTLNELVWTPGSGRHRLELVQSWARDNDADQTRTVWLASYRLFIAPLDLFLEATGGRFWGQDTGGLLQLKRFFGDTAVSLFYKNTVLSADQKRWQAAGIQFSFPLGPRRDMKAEPVQVRGSGEWRYAQETTLAVNGQKTNDAVSAGLGVVPMPAGDIYHSYHDRDRLNEEYFRAHLDRLRESWQTFRGDL